MIPIKKERVQEKNKYFGFQNGIKVTIVNFIVKWRYQENRENGEIRHEKVLQRIVETRNVCSVNYCSKKRVAENIFERPSKNFEVENWVQNKKHDAESEFIIFYERSKIIEIFCLTAVPYFSAIWLLSWKWIENLGFWLFGLKIRILADSVARFRIFFAKRPLDMNVQNTLWLLSSLKVSDSQSISFDLVNPAVESAAQIETESRSTISMDLA